MTPRVSVIMAVRNAEAHLAEAIDSILSQSLTDFEFLIVDDASDDATPRLLEDRAANDRRVRLIRNETNIGPYPSANRALELARAPLIARMDGDDVSMPERLARQVAFLESHPDHMLVGCGYLSIDAAGRPRYTRPNPLDDTAVRWIARFGMPMVHPGFCFRARFPDGSPVRYRTEAFVAQDFALVVDLLRGGKAASLGAPLVQYRMHDRNISSTKRAQQDRVALALVREVTRAESGDDMVRALRPLHETLYRARAKACADIAPTRRALRTLLSQSAPRQRARWMKRRASVYLAEAYISGGPGEKLIWAVLLALHAPGFMLALAMRYAETKGLLRPDPPPDQDVPAHRPQAQPRA